MEEIPLCTNCKRIKREASDFTGDDGKIKKTCKKCREKGKKYKRPQDQIDKRNERQREKKYYQKSREKKRNENEEEFLKRNSENARKWREQNKEYISNFRSNNISQKIFNIKRGAKRREISWDPGMTDEICINMVCLECYYCGFISLDKLNGIDRVDNTKGYTISNCVSCCKTCNKMKGSLDPNTFVNRCKHISFIFNTIGELHTEAWPVTNSITYQGYKTRALKKHMDFDITKEYYNNIVQEDCYYCKNICKSGLDRVYNNIGYIMSNIVSCCSECNYMKFDMDIDYFISHCKKVSEYSVHIQLGQIDNICLRVIKKRDIQEEELCKEKYTFKETLERNIIKKEILYTSSDDLPEVQSEQNTYNIQDKPQENIVKQKKITKKELKEQRSKEPLILQKLTDEELIELMTLKGKIETQKASDLFREKYNKIIQRSQISKLWIGEIIPSENVQNSEEYKNAISLLTKRVYSKPKTDTWIESMKVANQIRKLTDEQIIQVMSEKKTAYSAKELGEKFNVSRMTIDNVWTGKLLPRNEEIITDEYKELIFYKRVRMSKSLKK